jgi:hypothetical protein
MLRFNPLERFSAGQCLASPVFDDIRDSEMETLSDKNVDKIGKFGTKEEAIKELIN